MSRANFSKATQTAIDASEKASSLVTATDEQRRQILVHYNMQTKQWKAAFDAKMEMLVKLHKAA